MTVAESGGGVLVRQVSAKERIPLRRSQMWDISTPAGRRRFQWTLGLVLLGIFAIHLILGRKVRASALFADDYLYLYAAGRLVNGVGMREAFGELQGPRLLYPLLISGWTFFEHLSERFHFVFGVNAFLSVLFAFFGADAARKMSRRGSVLLGTCLATVPSVFILSYYALTENLFFPLLAFSVWILADGEKAWRGWRWAALIAVCTAASLVRPTGLAVVTGCVAALVVSTRERGVALMLRRTAVLAIAATVPYMLLVSWSGGGREGEMFHLVLETLVTRKLWSIPFTLFAAQLPYMLFASAIWGLPLLGILVQRTFISRETGLQGETLRAPVAYIGVAALTLVILAIVHLFGRHLRDGTGPFFFIGRYLDPAVALIAIGAAAAFLEPTHVRRRQALFWTVAVLLAVVSLTLLNAHEKYRASAFVGMSIFPLDRHWKWLAVGAATIAVLPSMWLPRSRLRWCFGLIFCSAWFGYNVATIAPAYAYTVGRASSARRALNGAEWLAQNAPKDAAVCVDGSILDMATPGGIKTISSLYLAMRFAVYPITSFELRDSSNSSSCDYFFSVTQNYEQALRPLSGSFSPAWSDGSYVLLRRDPPRGRGDR